MRARLVTLGLATLVACADAGRGTEDDGTRSRIGHVTSAVQGGDVDTDHPYAVGVCGVSPGPGQCQLVCSGTLIAPNLVLTARHCVDAATSQTDCATATWTTHLYTSADQYYVTTGNQLYQASTGWHRVAAIHTPTGTTLCGGDLALLVLQDLVPASEAVPATPAIQFSLTDRAHTPSLSETAIGYGVTSPNTATEGTRHRRSDIAIQCIPGDATIDCDPKLAFAGSAGEFLVGDGTCDGDSGSGAFEQTSFAAGHPVVLGALSRGGVSVDGARCIGGVYTRLDAWRDFIAGVALEAAQKGSYAAPDWTRPTSDAGAADATDGGGASPGPSAHGCAVSGRSVARGPEHYSSVPYEDLALGLAVWGLALRNCSRKRTKIRRAVGKKTGYC
jgi:hypothetical protein